MQKLISFWLVFGIFLLLFFGYFHTITAITQDLGRHLLTGKLIINLHKVPKVNLFSYTYPLFPFINHHWFSEVIFYLIYKISGFKGLLISTIITLLATFAGIFFYSRKKYSVIAIVISSLLYFPILFERTDIRPEIFSFLFLSLFVIILYSYREKYTHLIFLLIPLELLWVNIHIYFPIGIAVLGIFLIANCFELVILNKIPYETSFFEKKKYNPLQKKHHVKTIPLWIKFIENRKNLILFLVLLSCSAITLVNPNGFSGAIYPFRVFQNYGYAIEENQNIFFLENLYPHETILFFIITATLLFLFLLITHKKSLIVDWLLAIFFTYLGISAIRNFPLFVFGTFLIFCRVLSIIYDKLVHIFSHRYSQSMLNKVIITMLFFAIILESIHVISSNTYGFGVVTGASGGADFFIKHHISGPIFNNFDIGSFLEYRIYPQEKVFVDGRPEAYPERFFQQVYIPMQQDPNVFKDVNNKYHFNAIFFSYTDQTPWAALFLKQIMSNNNWRLVYLDDFVMILVKNNAKNKTIIKKFGMDINNIHITNLNLMNVKQLINLAYFFNTIGSSNQEESMYQSMLKLDANNCMALQNLLVLYENENNPAQASYMARARTFCPQVYQ